MKDQHFHIFTFYIGVNWKLKAQRALSLLIEKVFRIRSSPHSYRFRISSLKLTHVSVQEFQLMWYTHNVLIVWLIILIAFVNYSDCAFGPNWYTKKALWIDVSNRINYTLSKFLADFHWQSIGHRFACVWEYIVWSAFKCFRPIEFQMAPKYQIFNTPEETKSNQIVSRAELISMQITCNRCLNLSTKWEWICRAKTKFKTKTRVEYLKLALMHACSKGSINSDVMITLSLFATLSPFGMHFSLSFVYMWWYSISHRWIYTVWCMDSRHLQTGKLYEEIEIIIGSDGFCCSHAHVLHSHSHTQTTNDEYEIMSNHLKN